jgi:circadian clock protein KaiC
MDNIKTGIPGFDKLVSGGFPLGKSILLSGTPGTGKTIFALQFLYNGATKFDEKGVYISLEEGTDNLKRQALQFGWDIGKLEKSGKLKIISIPAGEIKERTAGEIINIAKKMGASRLVVDSLSTLAINSPTIYHNTTEITELSIKRFIYRFVSLLKDANMTSILISQTSEGQLSRDGVSEFICDGIVLIHHESLGGEFSRSLTVRKMREVKNDEDIHPVEIGKIGLVVHSLK